MAVRDILVVPDPILKKVSAHVEVVDDDLRALMDDMLETMYAAPGIGLAAIQVGEPKRVIVMDIARPTRNRERARAAVLHQSGNPLGLGRDRALRRGLPVGAGDL